MTAQQKKIQRAFVIYWSLLVYIIASQIWWFIALKLQNDQMSGYKIQDLPRNEVYAQKAAQITKDKNYKTAQYAGEGITFLLLIMAGAVFVYRAVSRELRRGTQQENFMMAITHELKTPIAVSKLNLETLQKWKLDEAQQKRLLNNTLEETNRLDGLCSNILLSSQIEADGYRVTNEEQAFSVIVENCADNFKARCPQRHFILDIAPDIFVVGDAFLLEIAVNNLLENAIKYSPKEKPVEISLHKDGHCAVMKIIDEGAGIPETEKKKVFQKFYRTGNEATRRAKGTGLGLYLVSNIAKRHGGKIIIQDNPKGGSIFVLTLKAEP